MEGGTRRFVLIVCCAALSAAAGEYLMAPQIPTYSAVRLTLLGALAVMAELLAFLLSRSATGSIAFIQYLAAVFVVPSWIALACVSGVRLFTEVRSRTPIKAAFNVAQHVIATAAAIVV